MANQGLLAIAFFEAGACVILWVLFLLLYRDLPARFFRLWLIGWTLFTVQSVAQIPHLLRDAGAFRLVVLECYLVALFFFFAAVMAYVGRARLLAYFWPSTVLVALSAGLVEFRPAGQLAAIHWLTALSESAILLAAGWILWRYARQRQGHGALLLAGILLLGGLHGIDQPEWRGQPIYLLRVAFDDLLEVALGIAMVALVLEAGRTRTEDLNEKLRRLTLITAASTQTFSVDEVLKEVLKHLIESINASHGLVRLLSGEGANAELVIRAAVGFSDSFLQQHGRVSIHEAWARKVLEQHTPFVCYDDTSDPDLRKRMEAERIAAVVLVHLPGKEAPLGVLGVGSSCPRKFQGDEINFLVNVANLLGLTIQNVWLFEHAANAERQWTYAFDSIGDPILVHDEEGRIMHANQALGERLGVEWGSLIGRPLAESLRGADTHWSRCPYCEKVGGSGDRPDPCLGGYFLASNSTFHAPGDERRGTVHVLKDITERKRAEEKYRTLIENVQEGVFISTPDGRFIDFNDAFIRMLGYESREELLGVNIEASHIYVNPNDRVRLKKLLRDHGAVTNFEFQMRRRDGEVLTVLESSMATRDPAGNVLAYQGFVLDITERKRAEQEIRRRNRELIVLNSIGQTLNQSLDLPELLNGALRQVVELFAVDTGAIYLLEEDTRTVRRAATFGLRSEYARHFPRTTMSADLLDHIGAVRASVLSAQSLPLPPVFRDLQQKEGIQVSHLVILWSKVRMLGGLVVGSRVLREFSAAELNLLTSVGNQIAAAIEKAQLHEETRQAYENLRRTQEQLLQSEKMAAVGQLISGVAHELNNPLTAILGYSQLLSMSEHVTPRGAEYVEKLYKQAQRTYRIVHNLLSFARQQKPERLPVRLNQVLEDTLALREYDLKVNNITLHRELAPNLPLSAADAHQLQQVFLNILNNAVDAILEQSDRGQIWVRTAVNDGRLLVEFTDSGCGVRDLSRVFDPFYTTKPVGKGTGLGLSICYGIVTEHGGEITVCNSAESSRGAIFTVSLPVLPVNEARDAAGGRSGDGLPGGRILLVDDEEAVLELEQEILRGCCQLVKAVRSGREAQEVLEHEPVDLIVTDVKMPGEVTARELYQWICHRHPHLSGRVVFSISDARAEEVDTLLRESGCVFVRKPFEVESFLGALRRALERVDTPAVKR